MVERATLLALAFACIAAAIVALRPHPTPGPLLRDFEAYYSAGGTWAAGANPYDRSIWQAERRVPGVNAARDELLPFAGPPQTLPVWAAFARLSYPVAARLWYVCLCASLLLLIVLSLRGAQAELDWQTMLGAIALAIGFAPVTSALALGQAALPALAGATMVAALSESVILTSIGALLAAFQPNVAPALFSQIGQGRVLAGLGLAALLTYAGGVVARGPWWIADYFRVLSAHRTSESFIAIQHTPAAIFFGLGAPAGIATILGTATGAAAIVIAVAICRIVRDPFARFAACCALVPFAAMFFHEHDFVVAYVPAVLCALRAGGVLRAIALTGTLMAGIDWLGVAQRPDGIAQSAALAVAAALGFVALREDWDARLTWAAAVGLVAFGGAVILAIAHPVPIWPDALGSFHAPAGASIARVWALEQRRAGLAAAVPAWAFLRLMPLLGCGLLAYATAKTGVYMSESTPRGMK